MICCVFDLKTEIAYTAHIYTASLKVYNFSIFECIYRFSAYFRLSEYNHVFQNFP